MESTALMGVVLAALTEAGRGHIPAMIRGASMREESTMNTVPGLRWYWSILVAGICLAVSVTADAQSVSGTVRDTSGAVLPGVAVEAASPALIERSRSVVTDANGQYQIIDLRPGPYTITFALQGFTTVIRQEVQLTGGGVTTINADMRVGGLQETVTVTGDSPVVDVQTSTSREQVLSDEFVRSLPASRGYGNYLAGVPGINGTGLDGDPSYQLFLVERRRQQRRQHPDGRHERRRLLRRRRRFGLPVRHVPGV